MNQLSWLLFWADVLPSLSMWLCICAFSLFAVSVLGMLIAMDDDSFTEAGAKFGRRLFLVTSIVFFILWGASFLVPSKDTFYMIAASEAGEQALKTPEFTKIRTVINQFLDDKIEKDAPKEKN